MFEEKKRPKLNARVENTSGISENRALFNRKTAHLWTGKPRTFQQENRSLFDHEHALRVVKIRAFERALMSDAHLLTAP